MAETEICPFRKIDHEYWPDNTCIPKSNYCVWPGDFQGCDIYKKTIRDISTIVDLIENKGVSNE